ncbi:MULTISPECIES: lipase maturation factor family protein [Parachlamydia]|uniref:lipase maturation factor family protein n=1 Tax=Parachlamydia TaxID=83551 RepID=UPI0001C17374|nr:lipase maturation factor family protein [Parachlamydia acanthamoebae]EFB41436.1 hypothetical protein pah_c039o008 [Parachlamydia acanthamoebae str. Hall's coccus]
MFYPESYTITCQLFYRLLGFIYFFAFGAFLFQIRGLIGENGILPLKDHLNFLRKFPLRKRLHYAPTLFWFNSSNTALMSLTTLGVLSSILLMLGWYPSIQLILLYFLYLSIVGGGQDFLAFGWEGFLLEITIHAYFMSLTIVPCYLIWASANCLLFRFHFQAGAVKLLSKDPAWTNLTAIAHHYQSQPLPNTIAWYAHKLPMWFQKGSVLGMFFAEMIAPFGIFWGDFARLTTCAILVLLQYGIWLTGNFSFLNHLTAVFCIILINNAVLSNVWEIPVESVEPSLYLVILVNIIGGALLLLQFLRLWNAFFPEIVLEKFFHRIAPLHLANRYGIFAVMTTQRYEIVIEGSLDGEHWEEYLFRYKPSEISRRPRRISPYQPRIDWQAWFLPFTEYEAEPWFKNFLVHLLKGTPDVLALLRKNPFPSAPPRYIRSVIYDYTFTSYEERKRNGSWWNRTLIGEYSPAMYLREKHL